MLIHNFGDETQGFQAPVDHNDRLKAEIPKKLHFMKETFFSAGSCNENHGIENEGQTQSNANPSRNNFVFDVP